MTQVYGERIKLEKVWESTAGHAQHLETEQHKCNYQDSYSWFLNKQTNLPREMLIRKAAKNLNTAPDKKKKP